ncbi:RraA family protein [Haloplanus halophilus]|uniref:RraA family protein n=1 Tax=Haloplanus halophilus TaxID=2949993 RepID=UPI00203D637A|nr:hypothetical protein [Haloplanus sp. GDY1]
MSTDPGPVESEVLDRLERRSPAAIADTNHGGVRTLAPGIDPVHADCAFAGTVRTVVLDPDALWAPVGTLDAAREDEVVVVDADESVDEAIWGELLSSYASEQGVRGMVTDGAVRDVSGIRELGFPAFAREVTPRGPSGDAAVERDVRVTVGGASMAPGDVLVGDESGVVVIDRDAVEDVAAEADAVDRKERQVERLIDDGNSLERAFEDAGMG